MTIIQKTVQEIGGGTNRSLSFIESARGSGFSFN